MTDTIYALSSGGLPSGVAVVRVSGPKSRFVFERMCIDKDFQGKICLSDIVNPISGELVDKGLVLSFVSPNSFTGEDVVEFQLHGGRAVVDAIYSALSDIDGLRHAEAGEFTYRAFENGKLDLTQAEAIADLISSETEAQRKLAIGHAAGHSRALIERWMDQLLKMRALLEAEIDFVEEDDIPGSVSDQVWTDLAVLIADMNEHLGQIGAGEIVRSGYHITLLGRPNSGKSTLLNHLADRDVAIVSDQPGTTRDLLEVRLNIGGQLIVVSDTAGIRESENVIEKEGIRRALESAKNAQLTVWLHGCDDEEPLAEDFQTSDIVVLTKSDQLDSNMDSKQDRKFDYVISAASGVGMNDFIAGLGERLEDVIGHGEQALFSQGRQSDGLKSTYSNLCLAEQSVDLPMEIRTEYLRSASDDLGKIVGKIDVEDILGVIFSQFCVGK